MAKEKKNYEQVYTTEETTNSRSYGRPLHINTEQLEYTTGRLFIYGGLSFVLVTLGVTYLYLLIQKIKA